MNQGTDFTKVYYMTSSARVRRGQSVLEKDATDRLYFLAVRNEYESAQIVLQAKEDCMFSLEASDLVTKEGHVLGRENFAFYYEKYIFVDKNWQKNGYPIGYYPDALIPVNAPRLHGENLLKKGENGAVFAEVRIPKEQPAGTYRGTFLLRADREFSLDVCVQVLDVELADETTAKSLFNLNTAHMEHMEGEKSQELYEVYSKCLFRHRLSVTNPYYTDDVYPYDDWTKACVRAVINGATAFSIPTPPAESKNGMGQVVDEEDFVKRLVALKEKSFEVGINLIAYVREFDWLMDEPFCAKHPNGKVKYHIERWEVIRKKAEEACRKDPRMNTPMGQEILNSIVAFPVVHTDFYEKLTPCMREVLDENGQPYCYDVTRTALCPRFEGYDRPEQRAYYKEQPERWWYSCNAPNAPYPGYHIDDIGYSARIAGWMMAEYDIRGNLFWLVNDAMNCNVIPAAYLEDIFEYPAHHGYGANGDGILLYPGKTYGIYGPVETIRLKAIRDGNEEYELLQRLIHGYAKKGVDARHILGRITAALYDGTRIDPEGGYFDISRETVLYLLELFEKYGMTLDVSGTARGDWRLTARAEWEFSFRTDRSGAEQTKDGLVCLMEKKTGFAKLHIAFGDFTRTLQLFAGEGLKIILHEELFKQQAITGEFTTMTINWHDLFRELRVKPDGKKPHLKLHLPVECSGYCVCDFLLRTEKEISCVVRNNGAIVSDTVLTAGWNRIHTKAEQLSGNVLELELSENSEIAFGEVYLFR